MKRTTHRERPATIGPDVGATRRAFAVPLVCLTLAALATPAADAQIYRWIDPDTGSMIISNNPPPASIRPLDVKKAQPVPAATAEAAAKLAAEAGGASKTPVAESKPNNPCQAARQNLAALESKQPVARPNAKGEPTVLDEAGRAAELAKVRGFLRDNC